jgi:3-hydroxyacyl-[acyl-carrier-protein] dehydratase
MEASRVMPDPTPKRETVDLVKSIIRQDLKLGADENIPDDMPLLGGNLDLDSLDVLLLLTSIEKRFKIKIPGEAVGAEVFRTVSTLADYIEKHGEGVQPASPSLATPAIQDPASRLPHRPPFLFVSRVITIQPDDRGEALWSVDGTESFFAGHFPGRPIVPGVLLAEALAQLSGLVPSSSNGIQQGRLAHVDVRFREPVTPPAEIRLTSRHAKQMGALRQFQVEARVGESVVAEGTISLHLFPAPSAT